MTINSTIISVSVWSLSFFLGFNYIAQAEDQPVFSKKTVDLGIVVSDLKQAAKFYIEVVGMKTNNKTFFAVKDEIKEEEKKIQRGLFQNNSFYCLFVNWNNFLR